MGHYGRYPSLFGKSVLVTGGAGFIGGAVVRRLLRETTVTVFNLDKMGYASDLASIEEVRHAGSSEVGTRPQQAYFCLTPPAGGHSHIYSWDRLSDISSFVLCVAIAHIDLVLLLAAAPAAS